MTPPPAPDDPPVHPPLHPLVKDGLEVAIEAIDEVVVRMIQMGYVVAGPIIGLAIFMILQAGGIREIVVWSAIALIGGPFTLFLAYLFGAVPAMAAAVMMTDRKHEDPVVRMFLSCGNAILTGSLWALWPSLRSWSFMIPFLTATAITSLLLGIVTLLIELHGSDTGIPEIDDAAHPPSGGDPS